MSNVHEIMVNTLPTALGPMLRAMRIKIAATAIHARQTNEAISLPKTNPPHQ